MKISSEKFTLALALLVISILLVACNIAESTEQIAIPAQENTSTTVPPTQTEITISPTNPAKNTTESLPLESSIDQVIASLGGLPIDQFFDEYPIKFFYYLMGNYGIITTLSGST